MKKIKARTLEFEFDVDDSEFHAVTSCAIVTGLKLKELLTCDLI